MCKILYYLLLLNVDRVFQLRHDHDLELQSKLDEFEVLLSSVSKAEIEQARLIEVNRDLQATVDKRDFALRCFEEQDKECKEAILSLQKEKKEMESTYELIDEAVKDSEKMMELVKTKEVITKTCFDAL